LGVAVLVLLAVPSFARGHHELNGTWKLIPTRGDFAGQPVTETGSVTTVLIETGNKSCAWISEKIAQNSRPDSGYDLASSLDRSGYTNTRGFWSGYTV